MIIGDGAPNPYYRACADGTLKSTLAVVLGIVIANGALLLLVWLFA